MNITMDSSDFKDLHSSSSALFVGNDTLPEEMQFTNKRLVIVIIYCVVFVIAAIGNLIIFITLANGRYRKSRISLMICHLSAADLLIVFLMIPIETIWNITIQWVMGNIVCKIYVFFRAFGFYLSNNILVCVSLDRYFAILHPLGSRGGAHRRGKIMLACAWIISFISAAPQSYIYHVEKHPNYTFTQCVTFGSFNSKLEENIYNVFSALSMYLIPIIIICFSYTMILCEINSKTQEGRKGLEGTGSYSTITSNSNKPIRMRLRCSDTSKIKRARIQTLKMSITIVAVFIIFWTPYGVMYLWYIFDKSGAEKVEMFLQDLLFMTAIGNSCANPLVYGSYVVDLRKKCAICCLSCKPRKPDGDLKRERRSTEATVPNEENSLGIGTLIVRKFQQLIKVGSNHSRSTVVGGAMLVNSGKTPRLTNVNRPKMYNKLPLNNMVVTKDNNVNNIRTTLKRNSPSLMSVRSIPMCQIINERQSA